MPLDDPRRHEIQLGTIVLPTPAGPSSPSTATPWQPLSSDLLEVVDWPEDFQPLVRSILFLLADFGVGFKADFQYRSEGMVIRISLVPSDAPHSTWKRTDLKGQRAGHLSEVFYAVRDGWDGGGFSIMGFQPQDQKRILDLYADVPSPPVPAVSPSTIRTPTDAEVYSRLLEFEEPSGIKAKLYKYQFRSVVRMLQMESEPKKLIDPYFTMFVESGREAVYYVNTATWDVQRQPGWYDLPRGGILCEQMGVGKTLMCLTLVLSTLHIPPSPPTTSIDISGILTDLQLATDPFSAAAEAREATDYPLEATRLRFPSLAEACAAVLLKHDRSAGKSPHVPPGISHLLVDQQPFYYIYPPDDPCIREAKRKMQRKAIKRVYLANTTLVIVPLILVEQWQAEIDRHIEEGALRVLVIGKELLPSVERLMEYDVILMDVNRFGQEETMFRMTGFTEPSELTKARWKRIILDEGHVAGDKQSNAMRLAISLNVERRWIVTGTPTRHLQQGGSARGDFNRKLADSKPNPEDGPMEWSKNDLEDAKRLGVIIGGFLATEPFRSEAIFQERVTRLLRSRKGHKGPVFGAVRRLNYLMSEMMVKHAPGVIDFESALPPSQMTVHTVRFHPMQRITYNVLTALVVANVYTSNFEDPDYFLHPRNVKSFMQVVKNLHLACFWYSAPEMGVESTITRLGKFIEKADFISDTARSALDEATRHLQLALNTPGWAEWMTHAETLPFELQPGVLPQVIHQAWSDSMEGSPGLIDVTSLGILREKNKAKYTLHDLHISGWDSRAWKHSERIAEMQKAIDQEEQGLDGAKPSRNGRGKKGGKADVQTAAHAPAVLHRPTAAVLGKTKVKSKKRPRAEFVDEELNDRLDEARTNADRAAAATPPLDTGPRPLPAILRVKSRSSKVDFVLRAVLESESDDKFVIFGEEWELDNLVGALELFDVKCCFVRNQATKTLLRAAVLKDFEKPESKVCLLNLKIGARGLNLVAANRMIMLAPIWNPDVQAQAIKRIHRIGQTKPTKVDILVTDGTFEEDISKRSSTTRTEAEEQVYSRNLIENPRFVEKESDEMSIFTINFVPPDEIRASQVSPATSLPDVLPVTPIARPSTFAVGVVSPSDSPGARPRRLERSVSPVLMRTATRKEGSVRIKAEPGVPAPKRRRVAFA